VLWWQASCLALICIQMAATVISGYVLTLNRQHQQLLHISFPPVRKWVCQGSDDGVSSRLRAERDGGRLSFGGIFLISKHIQTGSGASQASIWMGIGFLSGRRVQGSERDVGRSSLSSRRLRPSGTVHLLALCAFMACLRKILNPSSS
jgi:hypothetical protein